MSARTTFVYAFRNRDSRRVMLSLESLKRQTHSNFEVVFVDYGSDNEFASDVKKVVETFKFATYHYVAHPGLLWNKSKALNYGIKHAASEYIFIADVDIIFHPKTVELFGNIAAPDQAFLFKLGYIDREESAKLKPETEFASISLKHFGDVNGMILAPKKAFEAVHGFDEFFHFYGSEDVDVFQRLEFSGIKFTNREEPYFKHIWHRIYNSYNDAEISTIPRIFNIKRINKEHFNYHSDNKTIVPTSQKDWGKLIMASEGVVLEKPSVEINLDTTHAKVIHFFEVQLHHFQNEIIKINISETRSNTDIKTKLKKILKKNTEAQMTVKEVNDIVLSKIVYLYRNHNYSYKIAADFKSLEFVLDFKTTLK
ncbi:glycosyltransferase family 2 protein [Ulvibacter antarcticus]|uniref:GT2 family glycosyltransferase n=1 Tax=Ulvibacter antarcticus TaxID=442714 RepID=A0A3L9YU39_9FLAO|nr:glycosyltransferase [Ulvibacter antarcticus]RMA57982.1 GT2 family glycosyltransferase [Ulvibacter antarcticus]